MKEPVTQTEPVAASTENKTEVTGAEPVQKTEEKTFTQDEVNAMVLKATQKEAKKYEGIDLDKYKEWEESQKTEVEKQSELTTKLTNTTTENNSLRQENLVLRSGVNSEDVDYVVFKVGKMEGDFEDNLKVFLKDNPKYLHQTTETDPVKTTGVAVSKIKSDEDDGVIAILKAKHPEAFK